MTIEITIKDVRNDRKQTESVAATINELSEVAAIKDRLVEDVVSRFKNHRGEGIVVSE